MIDLDQCGLAGIGRKFSLSGCPGSALDTKEATK
jgi:hypothetical protein